MTLSPQSQAVDSAAHCPLAELLRRAAANDAVDLALGIPPLETPESVRDAAIEAIRGHKNQYVDAHGLAALRESISEVTRRDFGVSVDPGSEITITAGCAEGVFSTLMSCLEPGDEVVLFEPFFGNHADAIRSLHATPRLVPLAQDDWSVDAGAFAAAFNNRTRAVLLNTPHNPTGRVLTRDELMMISELCSRWGAIVICDEVYRDLVFEPHQHTSPLQLDSVRDRVVILSSFSKAYMVSGWRVGYAIASPALSTAFREAHTTSTLCVPVPFQYAAIAALALPRSYRADLCRFYERQHRRLLSLLAALGVQARPAQGGLFVMAEITDGQHDDLVLVNRLIEQARVMLAPGRYFFADPAVGRTFVRACFAKDDRTLAEAEDRVALWCEARSGQG